MVIEKGESWLTWQMLWMARAFLGWVDTLWARLQYVVSHWQEYVEVPYRFLLANGGQGSLLQWHILDNPQHD